MHGWLLTQINLIKQLASGSTFPEISKSTFRNFSFLIPDSIRLNKFNQVVEPVFHKIENSIKQIQTLTKTRDVLLPQLMSGKLRITKQSMKLKDLVDSVFIDPRKLTDYALCLENPKGKDKALMFQRYLGYTRDNYQILLNQLQDQALDTQAIPQREDQHGQRYQIDLEIQGIQPAQREIVRTG